LMAIGSNVKLSCISTTRARKGQRFTTSATRHKSTLFEASIEAFQDLTNPIFM
jgi:hypothetical protein